MRLYPLLGKMDQESDLSEGEGSRLTYFLSSSPSLLASDSSYSLLQM